DALSRFFTQINVLGWSTTADRIPRDVRQPHERRNRIDYCSKLAVREVRVVRLDTRAGSTTRLWKFDSPTWPVLQTTGTIWFRSWLGSRDSNSRGPGRRDGLRGQAA